MHATPLLLFVFKKLPRIVQRVITRSLFPTYIVASKVYLVNDAGKFIAVRTTYSGGWDVPGGHCDNGESPDKAAIRELYEETGVVVDSLEQRAVIFQPRAKAVQVLFYGKLDYSPELQPDNVEISEARWVDRGEVALNHYAKEALEVLLDQKVSYRVSGLGH